ncbi:MAG: hypothetical protein RMK20_02180 [Verrucomicrobiales bacterium]|nr:hypothetical protein [Verrucomicrobiales bacterium]
MNWRKLPKEKKLHLVLVALGTVLVLGALGFGLIRWQYQRLGQIADRIEIAQKRLQQVQQSIARAEEIEAEFNAHNRRIAEIEEAMASGDVYAWAVSLLRRFKLPYRVDIPQIGQPVGPADVNLLPKFPYKQVTLKIGGTAYYQDVGQFIADFENQFPYIRLINLSLEPTTGPSAADREKLNFTLDIVALVKPTAQ